jgi:vitamin B12 transporter
MSNSICLFRSTASLPLAAAALAALAADGAHAQDGGPEQVLITGSRGILGLRTDLLGSSYTILDPDDLEVRQTVVVSDILRDVPGVQVNRTGGAGGQTAARIRGAEINHTFVMIDGIEASDPFNGEFDFATLHADEAAKVEVLRGQQSALYGSNAMGGVVHYITLMGAEAPGIRVRMEGGSFDTLSGVIRAAGVAGALDYSINGAFSKTGGIIGARDGVRHTGAENQSLSGKLIYSVAENFRVTAVGRFSRTEAETTPQDLLFPPGPNYGFLYDLLPGDPAVQVANAFTDTQLHGLMRGDLELLDGRWTHSFGIQGVSSGRKNYDDVRSLSFESRGSRAKASYVTSLGFATRMAAHTLTGAVDFKREKYQNKSVTGAPTAVNDERRLDSTGLVAQYDVAIGESIGFGAAIRHDINGYFADATTYRVQGSYRIFENLRLRAATGRGVTNPTNFELFGLDPQYFIGNPDLKPEQSDGWEAGADLTFAGGTAVIGATYFNSKLEDEIFTAFLPGFLSTPQNRTTESTQEGVEIWITARVNQPWRVDASWTNLHALESNPGLQEVRRPPNVASLNVSWRAPSDRFGANVTVRFNGEQRDFQFTPLGADRVLMPAYTLVNVGFDYRINDMWQIHGRVENAFDEEYEEVFAYPAPGAAVYIGLRARFR